jgi:hypothetical protein
MTGPRKTVTEPVTLDLWKGHLTGKKGIGIVPIRDDNTCTFGAIDIDQYDGLDYGALVKRVNEYELPLILFRSKSGGVHAFAFVAEPVAARLMRDKLNKWASALGFGESEIFPKQSEILAERGDVGGWINIPYFNAKKTDRFALDEDGKGLRVDDFVSMVEAVRLTRREFEKAEVVLKTGIEDGPPCLECMLTYGIGQGKRNDGLFNLGVYLKRARPDTWQADLMQMNVDYFQPPMSEREVDAVVKSLDRKEYYYSCNRNPIKAYCNQQVCRTREFGIGNASDVPKLTGLTKYDTRPPTWFVDVEEQGRLELTTADLQNQTRFQTVCMDSLNFLPPTVKRPQWVSLIQELLGNVTVIEAPLDASPVGQLLEMVERFCTGRSQAKDRGEVLLDKPWTENGRHYFRIMSLTEYLDKHGVREFKVHKITAILKEHGGKHEFWKVKGKGVNVWSVPEFEQQSEPHDTPDTKKDDVF